MTRTLVHSLIFAVILQVSYHFFGSIFEGLDETKSTTKPNDRTAARHDDRTAARPDDRTAARPDDRTAARPDDRTAAARPDDRTAANRSGDRAATNRPNERRAAAKPADNRAATNRPNDHRAAAKPADNRAAANRREDRAAARNNNKVNTATTNTTFAPTAMSSSSTLGGSTFTPSPVSTTGAALITTPVSTTGAAAKTTPVSTTGAAAKTTPVSTTGAAAKTTPVSTTTLSGSAFTPSPAPTNNMMTPVSTTTSASKREHMPYSITGSDSIVIPVSTAKTTPTNPSLPNPPNVSYTNITATLNTSTDQLTVTGNIQYTPDDGNWSWILLNPDGGQYDGVYTLNSGNPNPSNTTGGQKSGPFKIITIGNANISEASQPIGFAPVYNGTPAKSFWGDADTQFGYWLTSPNKYGSTIAFKPTLLAAPTVHPTVPS